MLAFHRSLDGYDPTRLLELPDAARRLGVGRVFAKDESSRLGLPAFKVLGASWAVRPALEAGLGGHSRPLTFVTATDGNHGRAVARSARLLGHRAHVCSPRRTSSSRVPGFMRLEPRGVPQYRPGRCYAAVVAGLEREAFSRTAAGGATARFAAYHRHGR